MSSIRFDTRMVIPLALVLSMTPVAFAQAPAQSIFKCVDGETTSYQSAPCGSGQTEARVLAIARADAQSQVQPVSVPASIPAASTAVSIGTAQTRGKVWPPRQVLMLGISDDEVLNMPGWGVPKRIARTKAGREWKEQWTYLTSTGERRLTFVNATLVDAVVDPEATQTARHVATERRTYPAS